MARNPQPRELAELKGATKKDPQRYRNEVPKNPYGLGEPPPHMDNAARTVWFELQTYGLPGVLTASDRFIFEIAANLIAEYRLDPAEFHTKKYGPLISALSKLGLSPSDRQKLGLPKDKDKNNEFDKFQ